MAGLEPQPQPLGGGGDRVGSGDANDVEAERCAALLEGLLERLAVQKSRSA